MIPYFEWTSVQIGPLTLYVWGFFVAMGFILGAYVAGLFAKKRGQNPKIIHDLVVYLMGGGIVGGRLGYILFYSPQTFIQDPISMLYVWDGGLSIFGGFVVSTLAGIWYLKKKQVDVWSYADSAIFGLPLGLFIGRIGCFLIHDHPGTATHFVLGVQYPDGVVRHDHGLYLSINGLVLALLFLWISRKPRPVGTYIAVFLAWYGVVRFTLDFYRSVDVRYGGLTPAQYFSICLVIFGGWLLYSLKNNPNNFYYGRDK
ncbi:prolipoprotein diacylglyceryl transferase [Candidatus Uhrbacteria bacterium CG_4_9_14_3_um_filter_41_35]|uniref:Phosphatidylglycerol--prolipoprotein diacylglyceryl transferase n=1 Tax=Candidatus Uhrbacteria bacterium CG_4_9_14_3_um_filter_41_35 TaxID=1975034 RepID=A0A2M7XE75_9BACT|nr:MAG: prolipoprotein diacylglyceryl transferase [Candidatus Uhrbacteria bacterium CG11_big_fil_rev_8_21_14_0_20_41_9]PJA46177.1 MAG: prolipoprotein diacylglyceryl transferase [Candidatus Uhrbacteria bacterium CG_4_9_14_3_um_filter_41_35]